jgi:DNA (cytosine-5)-methyltransferase 1
MRYLTLCSGIEAPSVAWKPIGWEVVAFAEVDKFCNAVLAYHYPEVPNLGDITKITKEQIAALGSIDLVCAGTPCQGFSVAGTRGGLDDPRSQLAIRFIKLVALIGPRWVVWENVPGVLSSDEGRDFAAFIRGMADIRYFGAWRVLDAQYCGVPQRRRRVFAVFYPGDWRPATAVLFNAESMSGHPAPSREERQDIAPTISSRTKGGGGLGTDCDCDGGLIANSIRHKTHPTSRAGEEELIVVGPLLGSGAGVERPSGMPGEYDYLIPSLALSDNARDGTCRIDGESETFIAFMPNRHYDGNGEIVDGWVPSDVSNALHTSTGSGNKAPVIAYRTSGNCGVMEQGDRTAALNCNTDPNQQIVAVDYTNCLEGDITGTLEAAQNKGNRGHGCLGTYGVRRLTPLECERLQGFPDGYTMIPRGKEFFVNGVRKQPWAKDGPRYKALGNSIAVPCLRWIGERIMQVDALHPVQRK